MKMMIFQVLKFLLTFLNSKETVFYANSQTKCYFFIQELPRLTVLVDEVLFSNLFQFLG